jgi:glycerol 2-dehydrogenase (NADP+)
MHRTSFLTIDIPSTTTETMSPTSSLPTSFKLNNGVTIPAIGLGTWQAKPGEVTKAVMHAIDVGYRHIDCAYIYLNENEVGEGIKQSGVKREDLFLTSKVYVSPAPLLNLTGNG